MEKSSTAVPATTFNVNPTTEQVQKALQEAVDTALASTAFTSDTKLVGKALKALEVPNPDERFRKQFRDVAKRNLLAKATPDQDGNIRMPSTVAIDAEVDRLLVNRRAKQPVA